MSAPFEYVARAPRGELGRFVEQLWFARGSMTGSRERIAPTGSTVLGIVLGPPLRQVPRNGAGEPHLGVEGFLIGPHDQPIVNEPTGQTWAVGIVTTPVGCRAALGVDPAALRGRVVDADGWPAFGAVRAALTATTGAEPALDLVEEALRTGLDTSDPRLGRVEAAVSALEGEPAASIASIAAGLGISHGHLDREFRRIVGLGPLVLARILRLRRLVEGIDVYGQIGWTALAAELGWFDQAHLIRDFRRFTGVPPGEYAAAQRAVYSPDEAHPGFVPERM